MSLIRTYYLDIAFGEIPNLPLINGAVDGYWSLGVFKRFEEGVQEQWREVARVIRGGGYLFLTMPIMSPLRRLKARLNLFPEFSEVHEGSFYQYAYSPEAMISAAAANGFDLVSTRLLDGVKGLKDELPILRPALQRLYSSCNLLARIVRRALDIGCRELSGHVGYLLLRRAQESQIREDAL